MVCGMLLLASLQHFPFRCASSDFSCHAMPCRLGPASIIHGSPPPPRRGIRSLESLVERIPLGAWCVLEHAWRGPSYPYQQSCQSCQSCQLQPWFVCDFLLDRRMAGSRAGVWPQTALIGGRVTMDPGRIQRQLKGIYSSTR
jgi:hypothetical protein